MTLKSYPDWLLLCEPRPVQLAALRLAYPCPGFAYFMEMRLGKTAVALNEFLLFQRDRGFKRLLVIAPNKYKYGWRTEAQKFGFPHDVYVFEASRKLEAMKYPSDVMVVNYNALIYEDLTNILNRFNADMVVFDESILIKNRTTSFFKRGFEIASKAKVVRILTGKPCTQGPHDYWSQLKMIGHMDKNFFAFRNTFCKMGGFMGKQIIGVREENAPKLNQMIRSCAFVAERKEWGTVHESDYEIRTPDIAPEQRRHYREMDEEFITFLKSGAPITADQVLTKHIKLQQISSGFAIDENKRVHEIVPLSKLPKFIDLKESLENEVLHKALIIAYYVYSIEQLLEALKEFNPALIAGDRMMKRLNRHVEVEKEFFNEDSGCRIMVAQIQAVKYGHNLMGSEDDPCGEIFYYENTYNLDDRSQSEQRPQGIEQKQGLHIVDYGSTKVEKAIIQALQRKDNIANAILKAYD